MKLYTARISPYAAICRAQIYAKNLEVEMLELPDDASWEDVRAINPLSKIPVLVDGELMLPESQVICEYLEDRFPEHSLRPTDARDLARMRLLVRIADTYLMTQLVPLFAHLSRKHRDQNVVDRQTNLIAESLASLDHYLPETGFAVGQHITLADCTLAPILVFIEQYMPYFGIASPFLSHSRLSRYWDEIKINQVISRVIDEIHHGISAKQKK